jgi:hypothetical protein
MKKRPRAVAPHFKTPAPFDALAGQFEQLARPKDLARAGLAQVYQEFDDYLVCRLFDPATKKLYPYVAVAKPWTLRKTPWDGRTVTLPDGTVAFTYSAAGGDGVSRSRTAVYSGIGTVEETIRPAYFVGEALAVVRLEGPFGDSPGDFSGADVGTDELDRPMAYMVDVLDRPIAWLDLNVGGRKWEADWDELIRFELTENLALGGNATAKQLNWTGAAYVAAATPTFEVYDIHSRFCQTHTPKDQDGARGEARWCFDRGIWEIISMQMMAKRITFAVNNGAGFTTSNSTVTIDTVVYIDGYEPETGITTAYNMAAASNYVFSGDDNARGKAELDPATGHYSIYQMECAA